MPFNGGLDKSKSLFSDSTLCFCSNPQDVNLLKRRRYHLSGKTCHKYFDKVFIILKNRWLFRKDCQLRFADRNMFNNFKVFFLREGLVPQNQMHSSINQSQLGDFLTAGTC